MLSVTVRRSTLTIRSITGTSRIRPGPFCAISRPRRKITPRSYSLRTRTDEPRKIRTKNAMTTMTPIAPSTVVGACASAMKRSRATASNAIARPVIFPLSACGVLVHVRDQALLILIRARMRVDELARAVIEAGRWKGLRRPAQVLGDVRVGVRGGGGGRGQLREAGLGGADGSVRVDAE